MTDSEQKKQDVTLRRIAQNIQLNELKLMGCRVGQSIATLEGKLQPKVLTQNVTIHSALSDPNQLPAIMLFVHFTLHSSDEGQAEGQEPAFVIDATFAVAYSVYNDITINKAELEYFGQRNALYNVWPYWREFVQSSTARMGMPQLKIDLLPPGGLRFSSGNPPEPNQKPAATKKARRKRSR